MTSSRIPLPGWRRPAAREKALPDSVLLVPTFQRPREIVALLSRLEQVPDPPGEVVVVDGSRDDASERAVGAWAGDRPLRFDLGVVRSPAGLTLQRNVGLDASTAPYVFFLDDDCLPEPGYFAALRAVFEADKEERVGAVCGSIDNEMGKPMSLRWRLRFTLGLAPRDATPGLYYPTATSVPRSSVAPFSGTRPVDIVPGGATAYRRRVFAQERFSEFFRGYAQGEDLEMSLRIGKRWRLLWCGDAHVLHLHTPTERPRPALKGRMEVRNRYFVWRRHTPRPPWAVRLRFWADIAYVFAWDLVLAVARPPRLGHLKHAAGVIAGSASCFVNRPRWDEPPPDPQFQVSWTDHRSRADSKGAA
jgi:GT2 family glycosyltransferase